MATVRGLLAAMSSETTVLLVESQAGEREDLARRLAGILPARVRVVDAGSLEEAFALSKDEVPDCILIGETVSGFDLSRVSSLSRPNGASEVPVVVIAEDDSDDRVAKTLEAGAYDVFTRRRFAGPESYRVMRNALEVSRMRRLLENAAIDPEEDSVTRLPTRRVFLETLADALSAKGEGSNIGVLLIGIDGFKGINSGFGMRSAMRSCASWRAAFATACETPTLSPAGEATSSRSSWSRCPGPRMPLSWPRGFSTRSRDRSSARDRTSTSRRASGSRSTPRMAPTSRPSSNMRTRRCTA
jgi:DNA-binding NarL/FixJ family response regulator